MAPIDERGDWDRDALRAVQRGDVTLLREIFRPPRPPTVDIDAPVINSHGHRHYGRGAGAALLAPNPPEPFGARRALRSEGGDTLLHLVARSVGARAAARARSSAGRTTRALNDRGEGPPSSPCASGARACCARCRTAPAARRAAPPGARAAAAARRSAAWRAAGRAIVPDARPPRSKRAARPPSARARAARRAGLRPAPTADAATRAPAPSERLAAAAGSPGAAHPDGRGSPGVAGQPSSPQDALALAGRAATDALAARVMLEYGAESGAVPPTAGGEKRALGDCAAPRRARDRRRATERATAAGGDDSDDDELLRSVDDETIEAYASRACGQLRRGGADPADRARRERLVARAPAGWPARVDGRGPRAGRDRSSRRSSTSTASSRRPGPPLKAVQDAAAREAGARARCPCARARTRADRERAERAAWKG